MKNENITIINNDNGLLEIEASVRASLAECEKKIERGFGTFIEVGATLMQIREERLYRLEYRNFQEYCLKRLGFGKAYANRLAAASETSRDLAPMGAILNERQIRPLLKLPPEMRKIAWSEALKANPQPTQAEVMRAVKKLTVLPDPEPNSAPAEESKRPVELAVMNGLEQRCRAFLQLAHEEARDLADCIPWLGLRESLRRIKDEAEFCQRILADAERLCA